MKYEEMKVAELKEECRTRGLKLEHKGHKFNKGELIENLKNYDLEMEEIEQEISEVTNEKAEEHNEVEAVETKQESEHSEGYIKFAKTMDEIEKKYLKRKKQKVYDEDLKVGSRVVFFHYVEARDGEIYKKLRTAEVVGVNRKQELVRVETLFGTALELGFEDLIYIKGVNRNCSFPKDIKAFLANQRTEKGAERINERFASIESDKGQR